MSTQVFIKSNGCKPEYTKIAAHSFSFIPNFTAPILYFGGKNGPEGQATWSRDIYDYNNTILVPGIKEADKTVGISLPINLISDDVVTLSGTVYFNNTQIYGEYGYEVSLILGVYYFNCKDGESTGYTFIPIESFVFKNNSLCFTTDVILGSNFDIHDTRFLVGFNIEIKCLGECIDPALNNNLATLSYTFDIERPCFTSPDNFIIQNCCDPIITELVHIPGLTVGSFHVDDEGNCWEVIEQSTDVTNFTRNFTDLYSSCTDCITTNACPQNLGIKSCCTEGVEFVTGSLPGLNVGDTFVDNNGLCWNVDSETSAPISEESITVDTIIPGDCNECITANPCPKFWSIISCCGELKEIISTTTVLNIEDSFVDTNGICWSVRDTVKSLPTNYSIIVATVYPGPGIIACDSCIIANPCPETYFLTVRACCDNDRIEVISVPAIYMSFSEGLIFSDIYKVCWEVMSYSTTGIETYPINWTKRVRVYPNCDSCTEKECISLYQVRDCNTDIIYTASIINALLIVGSYYNGTIVPDTISCFEVLGYGYPTIDLLEVFIESLEYTTCQECNSSNN